MIDFFQHQESARRQTRRLVVLFALAVLSIFAITYVVVALFVTGFEASQATNGPTAWGSLFRPQLLLTVGLGVLVVVGGGMMYRVAALRAGGSAVAEMLGGRLIDPSSGDPMHRKILNIVEEMAIASGVPVPPVYIMEQEAGINAFAAGYSPSDVVVGVTRGCVELLSRDELQGVMAHEFSHILNGDMRLNIRLMGMIYGIVVIGMVGWMIIRAALVSGRHARRNSKNNPLPLLALGAALLAIGFIGVLFARLIKAAVSRQREYLADAAAVQFTRNPDGIAGALRKIGGFIYGSNVTADQAEEASHMFFGQAISGGLSSLMATHPPLAERVRRLDPSFDGRFEPVVRDRAAPPQPAGQPRQSAAQPRRGGAAAVGAMGLTAAAAAQAQVPAASAPAARQVGEITGDHLAYARQLLARVPTPVLQAAHEPYGARAVVYAMLLDRDPAIQQKQFARLQMHGDPAVHQLTERLAPVVTNMDPALRLTVIDMALPALRELSPKQYEAFTANMQALIEADRQYDLMEWSLWRIVQHHLEPNFGNASPPTVRYHRLQPLAQSCSLLLSTLTYVGHGDATAARQAFEQGASHLGIGALTMLPVEQCDLRKLDSALDQLVQVSIHEKRKLINAAASVIAADAKVTAREAELFRAIADVLGCPVPPLLPGQPLV